MLRGSMPIKQDRSDKMSKTIFTNELTVSPLEEGRIRLDVYMSRVLTGMSRTKIQEMVTQGLVQVNGERVTAKYLVKAGDLIHYNTLKRAVTALQPVAMDLEILFEDEHLIFINKPSGIAVHPGAGEHGPTLVHGLLHHAKKLGVSSISDEEDESLFDRPGIVHRLDKDTTGVMVVAKTDQAHASLAKQFHDKTNFRQYVALLNGPFPAGEWVRDSFLFRDTRERTRFDSMDVAQYEHLKERGGGEDLAGYRFARTLFKREAQYRDVLSLVSLKLETGRTHQIRLHARDLGAPVLGDQVYGSKAICSGRGIFPSGLEANILGISRQLLHAWVLGLKHPVSGQWLQFEARLPADFEQILKELEAFRD
jgi:23S rRNA pseudouridine1911/1915/1917 synthase